MKNVVESNFNGILAVGFESSNCFSVLIHVYIDTKSFHLKTITKKLNKLSEKKRKLHLDSDPWSIGQ